MSPSRLYRLVYVSAATELFSKDQLLALLEHSRSANHRRDVTGMLLYKDGNFIQLIEGPEDQVKALYAKIARDGRHHSTEVIFEGEVQDRLFVDWSMGFRDPADPALQSLPGFSDYMNRMSSRGSLRADPDGCMSLLGMFRSTM